MQLRITPTCLSVHELHTVYDYAWQNMIAVESCNFLYRPEYLRIGVLPEAQRQVAKGMGNGKKHYRRKKNSSNRT